MDESYALSSFLLLFTLESEKDTIDSTVLQTIRYYLIRVKQRSRELKLDCSGDFQEQKYRATKRKLPTAISIYKSPSLTLYITRTYHVLVF